MSKVEIPTLLPTGPLPEARAKRLKHIRALANVTREEFCCQGKTTINIHTLSGWENARFGGLTKTGAEKIISRIEELGVICTMEWLLEGTNEPPYVDYEYTSFFQNERNKLESEDQIIAKELALFKAKNNDSIDYHVIDDVMSPEYQIGDYVAGIKRFLTDDIKHIIGLDCLIETSNKEVFLRNLQPGLTPGLYTLVGKNLKSSQKNIVIFNIKIVSASPVIWHRKNDPKRFRST